MGLFGPKLTNDQKAALRSVVDTMNTLASEQQESFERTSASIQEFGANCLAGQQSGLGRPMNSPMDSDLELVRQIIGAHKKTLVATIGTLRTIELDEWIPAGIKKTREEWVQFWETQSKFIDTTLEGLAAPEPLVDQTGEAKLNMFISGFTMAGRMARGWKKVKA